MALPFEQQPRECDKAFAAFNLYLSLGPERSLAVVAQRLHKSVTMLGRWSAKFDWPVRVAAHGAHLAVVERGAIEAAARRKAAEWGVREQKLRETEWAMHERAIAAAEKAFAAFMAREKVYANLADIARMLEIASKLGRLATGLETDGEQRKGTELRGGAGRSEGGGRGRGVREGVGGRGRRVRAGKGSGGPGSGEVVPLEIEKGPRSPVKDEENIV